MEQNTTQVVAQTQHPFQIIVNALEKANKLGIYSLSESATILTCIQLVDKELSQQSMVKEEESPDEANKLKIVKKNGK